MSHPGEEVLPYPWIEKVALTGRYVVVVGPGDSRELHPLMCAALDVARNHWDEVLELHHERQGRAV